MMQQALTKLLKLDLGMPEGDIQRARELAHDATAFVARITPKSLCPYCKGLVEGCAACGDFGAVSKTVAESSSPELLDRESIMVARDGRLVSLATIKAELENDG